MEELLPPFPIDRGIRLETTYQILNGNKLQKRTFLPKSFEPTKPQMIVYYCKIASIPENFMMNQRRDIRKTIFCEAVVFKI